MFSPCGRYLWATVPTWPEGSWEANDELWLIDLASLSVIDRRKLEVCAAGSTPVQHPDRRTVGLSIGEGQDGAAVRWARADGGRIGLRFAPGDDRFLAAIHPDGQEYPTTPHSMPATRTSTAPRTRKSTLSSIPCPRYLFLSDLHPGEVDVNGHRLVVRNGYHAGREVTTAAGAVTVRAPRVNGERLDEATGQRCRFSSAILPAWARKSPQMAEALSLPYLHGLSTSDFAPALEQFLGTSHGL